MEEQIIQALEEYTFDDILEYNDLEVEDVLMLLLEGEHIELPEQSGRAVTETDQQGTPQEESGVEAQG
tara:strand:+ start:9270 stop:9473 length:204 start_codon:yes stop_codon:yes gene_type:complete